MGLIKRGKIYHVRTQVGGVMIAKSTKTSNKRVAEQLEAKWISATHAEVVVAGRKPITVEKAIESFLQSRRGTAGHQNAEIKLRMFQAFFKQTLHDVPVADVQAHALDMVQDEGYSINTVNVSLTYWNAVQNHCKQVGYTAGEKAKKIKGGNGRVRFLSDDEIAALLAQLDPESGNFREKRKAQDNFDFVTMLLHTGAREQEIAKLQLSQIDTTANTVMINRSKGGTDTTMRMSKTLIDMVARRMIAEEQPLAGQSMHGRTGNGFLFPERAETRYNNEWFKKACTRAKLKDVNLHTLRHTFACKALRQGLDLVTVQKLLGHRNLGSTMCYAHLQVDLAGERVAQLFD